MKTGAMAIWITLDGVRSAILCAGGAVAPLVPPHPDWGLLNLYQSKASAGQDNRTQAAK